MKAAELYGKAAALGDVDAMRILGKWYRDGVGGLPADREKARYWLEKAARQGDQEARTLLRALEGKATSSGSAAPPPPPPPVQKKRSFWGRLFGK